MPYKTNKELPKRVRDNLPKHAQEIFRKAFNNAYKQYKKPSERRGGASREETANKVAWSAVKKVYKKKGDKWVKK
ncbi:cation transport regulator ChaB [Candidatus Woesearchaeota archaeon]|nr:cation transport regulator ChaB [Candidatus Woesearchaeota archaeon]